MKILINNYDIKEIILEKGVCNVYWNTEQGIEYSILATRYTGYYGISLSIQTKDSKQDVFSKLNLKIIDKTNNKIIFSNTKEELQELKDSLAISKMIGDTVITKELFRGEDVAIDYMDYLSGLKKKVNIIKVLISSNSKIDYDIKFGEYNKERVYSVNGSVLQR
jgi:hypothetical protein